MEKMLDIVDLEQISIQDERLYSVMFVLLTQCNANCVHCYIPEHQNYGMDTYKIKGLIKQARDLGAFNITFNGGECLLRKDLLELIEFARGLYLRVFIMSNGLALDESYVKKLADLNIAEFSTTIFSMNEDIHDTITQVKGSLSKTLKNIELLKQYGIPIHVKTPLMEKNKYEYRDIYSYCLANGFKFMSSPSIFSKADGDKTPHDLEIRSDLATIVRETDDIMKQSDYVTTNESNSNYSCTAPFSSLDIQYDGSVLACNTLFYELGNIHNDTLKSIWEHSDKLKKLRELCKIESAECKVCELKSLCKKCPGLSLLEDNDLLGCSSTAKRLAECRRKL